MSFLTAPIVARKIGVVPTMAFSHGLASLIYLILPLAPTFTIAAAMTIIRSYLVFGREPRREPRFPGRGASFVEFCRHEDWGEG
jgi:hypothetical protein